MQGSACREFHAEKRKAVLAFAHLVDRKNVWMIQASYSFGLASETLEGLVRIGLVTQDALDSDDPAGVSLAGAINHAHAAARDLVEDFVIAQVPLRIRHVGFSEDAFIICSRHPASSSQSLAQETTCADPGFESHGCAALLAFCRARTRERNREPVRIHQSYSLPAARAAHRCRISSSTSAGSATVCATSSRSNDR